jgi:flavin reductase (DIM6/NTAB) family NADH-FMN oxidoreductase RutF
MQESAVEVERREPGFNSTRFRGAMSAFCTGVTVITTRGPDEPYGMTVNSFTAVSLDPPLILVCVIRGTLGSDTISRNGAFAVNILSFTQEPLSRYFASRDRPRGEHAFREVAHRDGITGSPILDGVAGHVECKVVQSYEVGDHVVFIGEVLDLDFDADVTPLVFHHGRYRLLHEDG